MNRATWFAAFVLGCAAAPLAQQMVSRPARAADGTKKFDQWCSMRTLSYGDDPEGLQKINDDLKARGLEGYELVTTVGSPTAGAAFRVYYCVKRPL